MYMLDTNICVHLLNGTSESIVAALQMVHREDVCISVVTASELAFGARKSKKRTTKSKVAVFLNEMPIDAYSTAAGDGYASVRLYLERKGTPIGPLDTLIAAHALALDATLVTDNVPEFKRVPGLQIENWHRGVAK
ncbi:MAG: PIN domain-containing protein [Myxococcota bacterium]